jgi:hypothetical protein
VAFRDLPRPNRGSVKCIERIQHDEANLPVDGVHAAVVVHDLAPVGLCLALVLRGVVEAFENPRP